MKGRETKGREGERGDQRERSGGKEKEGKKKRYQEGDCEMREEEGGRNEKKEV